MFLILFELYKLLLSLYLFKRKKKVYTKAKERKGVPSQKYDTSLHNPDKHDSYPLSLSLILILSYFNK